MPSMTTTRKLVIFTDLDGTLLGKDKYSFEPAQPALKLIKTKGIPLILASSKTRVEIEFYQKELEINHPFISENGGAAFIPKGYFSFPFPYNRESDRYLVLEFGTVYTKIVKVLDSIRKETGIKIQGFSDLTGEELTILCGLSEKGAEFSKSREYDEPFLIEGGDREVQIVKKNIKEKGLNYTWGGRFHHISGNNDKGKAITIVKKLFENEYFSVITMGIGNSSNDLPMLFVVDYPIFLMGDGAQIPPTIRNLTVQIGGGPQAWNNAILRKLKEFET